MCFGNQVQTEQKTTNTTLPSYLSNAAQQNVANAGALTSQPFTPYAAPRAAGLTDAQNQATSMIQGATTPDPYTGQAAGAYGNLISAPAQNVSAPSILGGKQNVNTSTIQDYMNPYLDAALQPQLQAIARQGDADRKRINAASTFSGAFGDARNGIEAANQSRDENILSNNTIGQGYNTAFNTAAGLRGQDTTNALAGQKANAGYQQTAPHAHATRPPDR